MNTRFSTPNLKFVMLMLALVLFGTSVAALPAQAQATNVPSPCARNCMRVSDINLVRGPSANAPKITATVTVSNSTPSVDAIIAGASVYAKWTLPNGMTVPAFGQTDANGHAVFTINAAPGSYTFTIINVVKSPYTFDRLTSILSATLQ